MELGVSCNQLLAHTGASGKAACMQSTTTSQLFQTAGTTVLNIRCIPSHELKLCGGRAAWPEPTNKFSSSPAPPAAAVKDPVLPPAAPTACCSGRPASRQAATSPTAASGRPCCGVDAGTADQRCATEVSLVKSASSCRRHPLASCPTVCQSQLEPGTDIHILATCRTMRPTWRSSCRADLSAPAATSRPAAAQGRPSAAATCAAQRSIAAARSASLAQGRAKVQGGWMAEWDSMAPETAACHAASGDK